MNKVKFLSVVSVVLLVSNLVLVGFIVLRKPGHPSHEGPRDLIIEKLHLDAEQVKQYDALITEHRKQMRAADEEIMILKNQLYGTLTQPGSEALKDSLVKQINAAQLIVENINYRHFNDIRLLCKPDQQPAFNELTHEIARLFSHPRKGMPK